MAAGITQEYFLPNLSDLVFFKLVRLQVNLISFIKGQEYNEVTLHPETIKYVTFSQEIALQQPGVLVLLFLALQKTGVLILFI